MNSRYDGIGSQEMWNARMADEDYHQCECRQLKPSPTYTDVQNSVIPFLDRRAFNFSSMSGGTTVDVILHPALCVLDYTRVKLAVRLHASSMISGQSLKIAIHGTMPTEEDPALDFIDPNEFMNVSFTSSTPVPSLVTTRSSTDPDAFLRIILRATLPAGAPTTFVATISGALVLRRN